MGRTLSKGSGLTESQKKRADIMSERDRRDLDAHSVWVGRLCPLPAAQKSQQRILMNGNR